MKSSSVISFSILIFFFIGCDTIHYENNTNNSHDNTKVKGEGAVVEQVLDDVTNITEISNIGVASITVQQAEQLKITLIAQQNILDVLTHSMNGERITFGTKDNTNIDTDKGIHITIETPKAITNFVITGAGNIDMDYGNQPDLSVTITGAGNFNAYNTEVDNCSISISGAGNCKVNVTNQLNVSISGVGSVFYKGSPDVSKNISGIGAVIHRN